MMIENSNKIDSRSAFRAEKKQKNTKKKKKEEEEEKETFDWNELAASKRVLSNRYYRSKLNLKNEGFCL